MAGESRNYALRLSRNAGSIALFLNRISILRILFVSSRIAVSNILFFTEL